MNLSTYVDFLERDSELSPRQIIEVIVFVKNEIEGVQQVTASEVNAGFRELGLPVPSRTAAYLSEGTGSKLKQYVKKPKGYALHRGTKKRLTEKLLPVQEVLSPAIGFIIIDPDRVRSRAYLVSMANQINGCYSYGFYDAAATLMRRLMESLLIEVFEKLGKDDLIRNEDTSYKMLKAIIAQAKNRGALDLSRNSPSTMDLVKDIGDAAAHDRRYITLKTDIDNVQSKYRRLINELCEKAGIT